MFFLRLTNGNCCGRCPRPRVPQKSSRATPFVVFCSTTFFCLRETASQFPYRKQKKRQLPRTLSASMGENYIYIDKNIYILYIIINKRYL